eukprot:3529173-Rhodomonas_salina.2
MPDSIAHAEHSSPKFTVQSHSHVMIPTTRPWLGSLAVTDCSFAHSVTAVMDWGGRGSNFPLF